MGSTLWLRELKQGLCNNLEGWDGGEVQEGGNRYAYGWFVLVFVRKQQNFCKAIILQLKINKI